MKERLTVSNFAFNLEHDSYTYSSSYTKEEIKKINDTSEKEIYAKLGKLEDIEEELGIDLIILFKALENGIWIKKYNLISFRDGLMHLNVEEKQIEEWYPQHIGGYELICYEDLKNYGKTWAFTKEELE